jgi:type IV secretory pathway TraG/TraD family ATPase VirD4
VLRFDPASTSSAHWNPLDEIQIGSGMEVADVQNLTTLIVDPDGKGLQTHWQKTSQALLVGVILHVLYKSSEKELPPHYRLSIQCSLILIAISGNCGWKWPCRIIWMAKVIQ